MTFPSLGWSGNFPATYLDLSLSSTCFDSVGDSPVTSSLASAASVKWSSSLACPALNWPAMSLAFAVEAGAVAAAA